MPAPMRISGIIGAVVVLGACEGAAIRTFGPEHSFAQSREEAISRASGHVLIHGTTPNVVRDQTISFNAVSSLNSTSATGQVQVHVIRVTGDEVTYHAEVTCIAVVGNRAWIGARVTRAFLNRESQPAVVGRPMIFRAVDGGEGDAQDEASLVFFGIPAGGDLTYCETRPDFPILRQSSAGNVQVIAS